MDFNKLYIPALHRAVILLFLPFFYADLAEESLALGALLRLQYYFLTNDTNEMVFLRIYTVNFLIFILALNIGRRKLG